MDSRTYRRAETDEEAHLTAGPVGGPGGVTWWSVTLEGAEGASLAFDGIAPVQWWPTHARRRAKATRSGCARSIRQGL